MRRKIPTNVPDLPFPGGLPPKPEPERKIKRIRRPIWTENKAKLIERYLYHFVLVTHHGTYIDGFAGPQQPDKEEMWAAKLVLESQPRWLKFFHLFDIKKEKVALLEALKEHQPERDNKGRKIYRKIEVKRGDFNVLVHELLGSGCIKPKQATFCLLDQHTTECHWSTVRALTEYKTESPHKIEIFYFLAVGWLGRTLAATTKDFEPLDAWWGGPGWRELKGKSEWHLATTVADRFKNELHYKSVLPWPIFEREGGGRIMYYMIHATDHPDAPGLMSRAYDQALQPKEALPEALFEWRLPPAEKIKRKLKRLSKTAEKQGEG